MCAAMATRRRAILSLLLGISLTSAPLVVTPTSASAATVQDQMNPGPSDGQAGARPARSVAQIFRAGVSGALTRISLTGCDVENNITAVEIRIYPASSVSPTAVPSGPASSFLGQANISGAGLAVIPDNSRCSSAFDVVLDTPASITQGNLYAFVVSVTKGGNQSTGGLRLLQSPLATYSEGNNAQSTDGGSSWSPFSRNFLFATYVDIGSPSPIPVLQQFGKPIVGTCLDEAPVHTQLPGAPSGGWGHSWAEWMNDGTGGLVCTRTLVYSTSRGGWVVN